MNELRPDDEIRTNDPSSVPGLDEQLMDLIEFTWVCEAAARREDRLDAAITYGSK